MNRSLRALTVSAAGAALLTAPMLTSAAEAKPGPVAQSQATSATAQKRVKAFWTPAAMRAAVPIEKLLGGGLVAPQSTPNGGAAWTSGGKVVTTTGRVFFTFKGRNASCSGSAVTSGNKSTVITAGHCVKLEGAWHTNWAFVPAYNNGATPYGTWTARTTLSTPQWTADESQSYDIGAAVVNQLGGKSLTDVVGGQAIAFNLPKQQSMYAFGYPAAAPYDGSKLVYCSGTTGVSFLFGTLGLRCNMTGGASGGPWFVNFDEATGTGSLNSVNSYKLNLPFLNGNMYGPHFGPDAQNLYNQAQAS